MRGVAALVLLAAALASCRCHEAGRAPPPPQLLRRSTDLRTAVLAALPEFREVKLVSGSAVLRRKLAGPVLGAEVRETFAAGGWKQEPQLQGEKTLAATRGDFRLEADLGERGGEARLLLPIRDGDPAKLLTAPISMTTEHMALELPRLKRATMAWERFEVTLEYEAQPERAHFLVWQLVDLCTRGQWKLAQVPQGFEVARKPDGGIGEVPEQVSLAMEDSSSKARLLVDRRGGRVRVEYQLDTLAAP